MESEQIDWKSGRVVHWDLGFLEPLRPLAEQLEDLKEDLVQVEYADHLLDVGWYPEFAEEGEFVVRVVCGTNWERPLYQASCRTVDGLRMCVEAAIAVAQGRPRTG